MLDSDKRKGKKNKKGRWTRRVRALNFGQAFQKRPLQEGDFGVKT